MKLHVFLDVLDIWFQPKILPEMVFIIDVLGVSHSPHVMFRYLDMLWPLNPVWPPSAIMDCRIRGILFLIRKLMDIDISSCEFFSKKKSPLTWTVLNSYNLLEVVNLSGSRHLRFLVSTKNTDSNDFYVSHIFLEVSHIPLWCLDTDICYGLKIQYGRRSPSWIGGSGKFYFRFWHFGTGSILIQKKKSSSK